MNPQPTWVDPTIRAWLNEPVQMPEDGLAEALRRVHETPQQRRWWPVVSTRRSRSMFSAPRLVAAAALFALTTGAALVGIVGPRLADPVTAPAAPSSAPSDAASPAPTPSASPVAVADNAAQPITRTLVAFPEGTDPTELVRSEDGLLYYLDRPTGTVWMVDLDGYATEAIHEGDANEDARPTDPTLGEPRRLATGDTFLLTVDAEGDLWGWDQRTPGELLRHPLRDAAGNSVGRLAIEPETAAIAAYTRGYEDYDLFVVPAELGQVVRYRMVAETSDFLPPRAMLAHPDAELTEAVDLYADPSLYVLLPDSVSRVSSEGLLDEFVLEAPSGGADFRFLDGIGTNGSGRLFVYDAARSRILEYAKRDGALLGAWTTGLGQPAMDDVRGMAAVAGSQDGPPALAWMTPEGIFESVLSTDVSAVQEPSAGSSDEESAAAGTTEITETADITRKIRQLIGRLEDLRSRPDRSAVEETEMRELARDIATLAQAIEPPAADVTDAAASEPEAIDWRTPAVTFEADRLSIRTNGLVFDGVDAPTLRDSAWNDELELWTEWREHDRPMRLVFEMRADDTHWWVDRIMTYDGVKEGEYLGYPRLAPRTRTPRGETLAMDLRLAPSEANRKELMDDARLRIEGMRLTAFATGTNAAPLEVTGCQPVPPDAGVLVRFEEQYVAPSGADPMGVMTEAIDYFAAGTPLEGIDLLPPEEASERLMELGICHEFRYSYDFADPGEERTAGTSERWCTMPDVVRARERGQTDGPWPVDAFERRRFAPTRVEDGYVTILVVDDEPRERREQPPAGWNCPTY